MTQKKRKLIAVGDLHGDFYRLVRILSEQGILDSERLEWKSDSGEFDLVLLGDYVDWRGEPLEGPYTEWPHGIRRLLELIFKLASSPPKLSRFHPLLGNHDEMMLQGHALMKKLSVEENQHLTGFPDAESWVETFARLSLPVEEEQDYLRFLNWFEQGGDKTIRSFGGLVPWLNAMEGELGDFFRRLPIAVVVNEKLFCHSVPDEKTYWVPVQMLKQPDAKTREQFLWGRKVWGYDAFFGGPTRPLSEGEVDEMLELMGVKGVVVGHTSLRKDRPYFHYGGKVINLDTHGIPGSQAFVEEYTPAERAPSGAPRRASAKMKKKLKMRRHFGRN